MKKILFFLFACLAFSIHSYAQVAPNFNIYMIETRFNGNTLEDYFKSSGYTRDNVQVMTASSFADYPEYTEINTSKVKGFLDKYYPSSSSSGWLVLDWEEDPYSDLRNYPATDSRFKSAEAKMLLLINTVKAYRPNVKVTMYGITFRTWNTWQFENYNPDGKYDKILSKVDFLSPSVYNLYADESVGHERNLRYIRENLTSALKYGKRLNKPVLPVFWHRIHFNDKNYGREIMQKEVLASYVKLISTFSYDGYKASGAFWWDNVSGRLDNIEGINGHLKGKVYNEATYDAMLVNYAQHIKDVLNEGKVTTPAPSTQQVVSYTLFNADTKQDIKTIESGATLDLSTLPSKNINIRANTNPATVGSVVFSLSGASSKSNTESGAPYDFLGGSGSWTPAEGSYTLKATPYTESNGSGTAGTALTVNFNVTSKSTSTAPSPSGISLSVYNADTKTEMIALNDGATIDLGKLATKNLNIRANISNVGSVKFALSGTATKSAVESSAPYDLMGDNGAWVPATGTYTLKVTPYSGSKGSGTAGTSYTVNFVVVSSSAAASIGANGESFTLINADTDTDIITLASGANLNLATLPTKNLNIRFNNGSVKMASVKMVLSGAQSKTAVEGIAPYALFADDTKGDYYAWTPATGSYTLKATPYSESRASGTAGTTYSINFTVSNSLTASSLSKATAASEASSSFSSVDGVTAYPNPATSFFNIEATETGEGDVSIKIYDFNGQVVLTQAEKAAAEGIKTVVDINNLKQGLYILEVVTPKGRSSQRIIKE
ncbi:T9SS type A sorting domain-containing protein [Pontibacter sp. E15-1]|uniref:T9SS type A sorting domain-containing protein n=1 Tax=Pontibacter sp. E15-1 TaxID=2919918 RepID=UPI001F4F4249|nr:T9SS type A sorting domain-containing protein [Pontibacter sp. E15-1]MCJ8164431.1 T9SS type A sorting domain-containing protein [Pontibacter sp. E15-1]